MSVMNNQKGFTIAELLVGGALLAVLMGVVGWFINYSANVNLASSFEQRGNKFIERLGKYFNAASQSIKSDKLNRSFTFDDSGVAPIVGTWTAPSISWLLDSVSPISDLDRIPLEEKKFPIFNLVRNDIQSKVSSVVNLMQDSHTVESPRMVTNDAGDLEKVFSYYLVSRCVPRTASTLTSAGDGRASITPQAPELSAYYVLVMLNRRPFFDTQIDGGSRNSSVRCCPVSSPNCTDGTLSNYLVRTYGIKMDVVSNRPVTVTEYPSIGEFDPVLGSGFMLTLNLNLNTYKLKTFTILNQCLLKAGARCQKFEENPVALMPSWYPKIKSDLKNGVLEKSLASGGMIKIGESQ